MPRRPTPDDPFLVRFGAQIRERRLDRNMSIEKLAIASGVCKGSISSIEHGRVDVTTRTSRKLAKGLGVEVWELFRFEGA